MGGRREMKTVGLLTGTFDPVHLGHVAMARAAMAACGLDEVWFLVNPDPVHKAKVVSLAQRSAMVRLALAGEPGMSVYSGELAEEAHSWATFNKLTSSYSGDCFVFIVGMDTLMRIEEWDDVESVVRQASIAVAKRVGEPTDAVAGLRRRLGALGEALEVSEFELAKYADVSSRKVKLELAAGERPAGLDARVYEYIVANGLYRQR